MTPEYPIKKFDHLNRLVYIDWNGYERIVKRYWGDTEKIKIKYSYFGQEVSIDAYDESGKIIMTLSNSGFEVNMKGLKMNDQGVCQFNVDKNILNMWKKKYKFKPNVVRNNFGQRILPFSDT